MLTKVALYARFSTDLQNPASAEDQLRQCRAFAAREGWTVVAEYRDEAISGTQRDRPGLNALLAATANFDMVLAESLDRVSRDQEDIAGIYKRLRFARCQLHTISEGAIGEMAIGFRGTMSAMQLKDIGDKTRRGQLGRVAAGRIPGGLSYGYRKRLVLDARGEPERGLREIHAEEAAIVREIFTAFRDGNTARCIAADLNRRGVPSPAGGRWNASTIYGSGPRANGILRNALYVGKIVFNRQSFDRNPDTRKRASRGNDASQWVTVDAPDLRIIDQPLWDAVAARLTAQAQLPRHMTRRPKRMLAGLVKCGSCGGSITIIGTESWGCARRKESGDCSNNRTIMTAPLERRVMAAITKDLLHPETVAAYVDEYHRAMAEAARAKIAGRSAIEAEHRRLDARCRHLAEAIAAGGNIPELLDLLQAATRDRDAIAADLAETRPAEPIRLHPAAAIRFRETIDRLAGPAGASTLPADLQANIRACIAQVTASPNPQGRGMALKIHATLEDALQTKKNPRQEAEGDHMGLVVAGARTRQPHMIITLAA